MFYINPTLPTPPTAPPYEAVEPTDSLYNFRELHQISSQTSASKSSSNDFKFKPIYLTYDPVFRSFDDETNASDFLEKLKKVDCHSKRISFHTTLAVLEKTFLCHVWSSNKHSSSLLLESVVNHIEAQFTVTSEEMTSLADDLRSENELPKSLLYYQAGAVLAMRCVSDNRPNYKVGRIQACVLGLNRLTEQFIGKKNLAIVSNYILPEMNSLVQAIKSQIGAEKEGKAKSLAWCYFFASQCDIKLGNWANVKVKTREGMNAMRDVFKAEAPRDWVFGVCSHYYGMACFKLLDFHGAVQELKKALAYRSLAQNYRSAEDKRKKIEMTASLLKAAKSKLKS